jgi:hypothetical protein
VAARSKAWVCGRSPVGIAGSHPAGGIDVLSLVIVVCYKVEVSRRADHSSRVLPSVECLSVCSRNLVNEEALARVGQQRHRKENCLSELPTG